MGAVLFPKKKLKSFPVGESELEKLIKKNGIEYRYRCYYSKYLGSRIIHISEFTLLDYAIRVENRAAIYYLVDKGSKLNETSLRALIFDEKLFDTLRILVEEGHINLKKYNSEVQGPLLIHWCESELIKHVKLGLEYGLDPNEIFVKGVTPTTYIRWVQDGKTPLHSAVQRKKDSLKFIELLLNAGANPRMLDDKGLAPIDKKYMKEEIVRVLLKANSPFPKKGDDKIKKMEIIYILVSARVIKRISKRSATRLLPTELYRYLYSFFE